MDRDAKSPRKPSMVRNDVGCHRIASLRGSAVQRLKTGDGFVVANYGGWSANSQILVPTHRNNGVAKKTNYSPNAIQNLIDSFIDDKLTELGIEPSAVCDDTTFLRRITLATIGQLPSVQQVLEFVAMTSHTKREEAIGRLLVDSLHASKWATRMCEITGSRDTGNSQVTVDSHHEERWYAWFRTRFAENIRFDAIVRQILFGTTRDDQSAEAFIDEAMHAAAQGRLHDPLVYEKKRSFELFWQRSKVNEEVDVESLAERVSAAFMGVRMECAKCHKHPFDRWTQDEYRSFANVFAQVRYGLSDDLRMAVSAQLQQQRDLSLASERRRVPAIREVYLTKNPVEFRGVLDRKPLAPKPLGSDALNPEGDRRVAFAQWLTSRSNPYFSRNAVNRIWEFYFGRGIVDPVDAFSASNPPSHPELLDALAVAFVDNDYNIRWLENLILQSRTWQRSAASNSTNGQDIRNYSRFQIRVLPADAIVDSLSHALDETKTLAVCQPTFKTSDIESQPCYDVFSRPERRAKCDCQRGQDPTLRQAMLLQSDLGLLDRIDKASTKLVADVDWNQSELVRRLIERVFLSVFARRPNDEEQQTAYEVIMNATDRHRATSEVVWSLINTREFVSLY